MPRLIGKMTTQTVIASLRATGSTDPVVLAAAKEELLTSTKRLRVVALLLFALGAASLASRGGTLVGIPTLLAGVWAWWRMDRNFRAVEVGFAKYSSSLPARITLVRSRGT